MVIQMAGNRVVRPMETAGIAASDNVRPLVGRVVSNRGVWIFGGVLALAGIGLFSVLEARRNAIVSPATAPMEQTNGNMISAPPSIVLPGPGAYFGADGTPQAPVVPGYYPQQVPSLPSNSQTFRPRVIPVAPNAPKPRYPAYHDPNSADASAQSSAATAQLAAFPSPATGPDLRGELSGDRVRATHFINPSVTVVQGTVIQAVLETALDSSRPGFVRAIISRDVRSFDGTKVLIPRGSRLFGEYKADLAQGQSRAFVQWLKLTRPDGAQIVINSPAADPLGRAGVGGRVNTHFLQRFSGALLQSTLDIGVGLATRSATNGSVIVGLPGSTQNMIVPSPDSIKPTLTVRHGTSVSVFVARDLDFSTVE